MKTRLLPILVLFLTVVAAVAQSGKSFLGWIPVQVIPPGQELEIDMNRFLHLENGDRLEVEAGDLPLNVHWDPESLRLKIRVPNETQGLIDVPLNVSGSNGKIPGVLTVAVQEPGIPATKDLPVVFAERVSPESVDFRVSPPTTGNVSAVLQNADGSSRRITAEVKDGKVRVDREGIPADSWIRVIVSDDDGRISRAVRVNLKRGEWNWQDGIIYYAFTDRFVNGQTRNDSPVKTGDVAPQANYQGGDFDGITQRITEGYFRDLGVNVLWLAPLNRNPDGAWQEYLPPYRHYTGYHGYWPISHTEVEPRFGGEQGLKNLVAAAHKDDIRIIADLVLKHVHKEHPLWTEKREWFGTLELPDGRKNLRLWDEQQFTTWFEEWLPGFDFSNPEAVNFLLENARFWIKEFDLDGYRLDAVKHIQHSFWTRFRTTMRDLETQKDLPQGYYVGETFMDRRGIMSFVGPNMLDGQFDFPLYDTIIDVFARGNQSFEALEKSLSESETIYGKETPMSPLVGNHDKSRFMAWADGDLPDAKLDDEEEVGWANPPQVNQPEAYDKLKQALAFVLAIDGVPMIYYGDEVGLTGAGDPDNRRMMPAEKDLTDAQKDVRDIFRKAAHFRNSHPALRYGSRRVVHLSTDQYAFVRRHLEDAVLAAWNRANEQAEFEVNVAPELPDGTYKNALGPGTLKITNGQAKITLPPRTAAFFHSAN